MSSPFSLSPVTRARFALPDGAALSNERFKKNPPPGFQLEAEGGLSLGIGLVNYVGRLLQQLQPLGAGEDAGSLGVGLQLGSPLRDRSDGFR